MDRTPQQSTSAANPANRSNSNPGPERTDSGHAPRLHLQTRWVSALMRHLVASRHLFQLDLEGSYLSSDWYRLAVRLPGLFLLDSQSRIHLSLFVHKTSANEESWLYLGAVRQLCGNPMVFTQALNGAVKEPAHGFAMSELPEALRQLPAVRSATQKRINWLQRLPSRGHHLDELTRRIGLGFGQRLPNQLKVDRLSQWQLLNQVTHYVSREAPEEERLGLLLETSELFKL